MKRRNFLKSIIGAASAVAVPSLALAKDNIVVRKGLPPEALRALRNQVLDNHHMQSRPRMPGGMIQVAWEYRGWDVCFKSKNYRTGIEEYIATRGEQYINCEIDSNLLRIYTSLGKDKANQEYINSELDAYIEEANRQWLGKGPITFNGQKVGYSDGKGNIK